MSQEIRFPRLFTLAMIALLFLPLFLTGCSALAVVENTASIAVSKYCSLGLSKRRIVRSAVASRLQPNSIKIECAGD